MNENQYERWYGEFKDQMDSFRDDKLFESLESLIRSSRNTFAMNRKIMEKVIDVSWVEAIENGLVHVDNFLRAPRKTIEDVEEVVPIALSKKITVESVKHLAQHTDLIQSIDKRTGKITPSKILNVHKEESMMTYENKFVNTLIDRLYIFINTRYEKLAQVTKDEKVMSMGYDTDIDDGAGGKFRIELKVESTESLDSYDAGGMTIWQRVEKLKKAIEESQSLDVGRADEYTVAAWLRTWFELYAKPHIRPSTMNYYHRNIEQHIIPAIGDIPLNKLSTRDLQKLYNNLQSNGRLRKVQKKEKPGLSNSTVRGIHMMLHNALDRAVKEKLILTNPTENCIIPIWMLPNDGVSSLCSIWNWSADRERANWWRSNGATLTKPTAPSPSVSRPAGTQSTSSF